MTQMNKPGKDNVYAAQELIDAFNEVLSAQFANRSGMKKACQEVAFLAFLRLSAEERLAMMDEIARAQLRGGLTQLTRDAIGSIKTEKAGTIGIPQRPSVAAKVAKPTKHGAPAKTNRQT